MKNGTSNLPPLKAAKLLDQVRERIRYLHYSLRTEESYVFWVRAFIRFHGVRHPATMGGPEVEAFLSWLASTRKVSASTHKQALSALLFQYSKVLVVDLPWMANVGRPRTHRRLPVVLSAEEVAALFALMEGEHRLLAQLLYGTGMRITEGLRLRVKDVDFERRTIIVREGKGGKDRALMLPQRLIPALREQFARGRVVDVVLGVSASYAFDGSSNRCCPPPSSVRSNVSAQFQTRGRARGHRQAGFSAYAAPFICHAPAAIRLRHTYGAGTVGALGCGDDDDLHAGA